MYIGRCVYMYVFMYVCSVYMSIWGVSGVRIGVAPWLVAILSSVYLPLAPTRHSAHTSSPMKLQHEWQPHPVQWLWKASQTRLGSWWNLTLRRLGTCLSHHAKAGFGRVCGWNYNRFNGQEGDPKSTLQIAKGQSEHEGRPGHPLKLWKLPAIMFHHATGLRLP